MNGRERKREEPVITIGVTDLRPPLFVGMRVSFVPDTLTFSRKHSCLHSCSLGRDTHYSPLLPFVPPSSFLASTIFPPLNVIRAPLNARTHTHTHVCAYVSRRACISRERRLKRAAVRANTHACPSRAEEVDNPLALPLARSLLPFLTSACSPFLPSTRRFP